MLLFAAEQKGGEILDGYSVLGIAGVILALLVIVLIQIWNDNKDD